MQLVRIRKEKDRKGRDDKSQKKKQEEGREMAIGFRVVQRHD